MSTSETIILETPIQRGELEITSVTVSKPNSGSLRGTSLRALLDFQSDDILKIVPRITEPTLTAVEVNLMDPADLTQIGMVIADFLLPKRMKSESTAEISSQN